MFNEVSSSRSHAVPGDGNGLSEAVYDALRLWGEPAEGAAS